MKTPASSEASNPLLHGRMAVSATVERASARSERRARTNRRVGPSGPKEHPPGTAGRQHAGSTRTERAEARSTALFASFAVLLLFASFSATDAADWPQWGGDAGKNMVSVEKALPASFVPGETDAKTEAVKMSTTRNVKWVAKLGSQTYGNPTVASGKVFVGTNNESPRDPRSLGDRGIVMCFDEKTGEFLWQLVSPSWAPARSATGNTWASARRRHRGRPRLPRDQPRRTRLSRPERHGQRQRRPVQGRGNLHDAGGEEPVELGPRTPTSSGSST